MNTTYHKFLIISAIAIILGGVYVYFSNDLKVHADTPSSSLVSSSLGDISASVIQSEDQQIAEDTAFLLTLTSLTKIKIDTSLFSRASFNALNDNTVLLQASPTGRPNPFAPINTSIPEDTAPVSPVITNSVTGITNKSAVLNGTLSDEATGVTTTYFEYGPTEVLGKSTAPVKQSLIGTFVTTVNGLASRTPYFFRAVAKINGTLHFGEIISFDTN